MKYYLIVGEASGDLHASHLMRSLKQYDPEAEFRFFGGDNMIAVGGTCVRHYKTIAYMGFIPVLMHLRTIKQGMEQCKRDIMEWHPDVVIPVDYAGFNLSIAKFLQDKRIDASRQGQHDKKPSIPPVYYYISPKIWAWKEYRIKNFKRDVTEMFSILPFEVDFFEKKHNYPVHYVGNPTADEVRQFRKEYKETKAEFCHRNSLNTDKPIIAVMPGSRKQEIKDNLPMMLRAVSQYTDYQPVLACAPSIDDSYYDEVIAGMNPQQVNIENIESTGNIGRVHNDTYPLLSHATAALVTSGTATLETALFDVPQVVCYKTPLPRIFRWGFNHIIKCNYISLVNLIADKEVVQELFADRFTFNEISEELNSILPGNAKREVMLKAYDEIDARLGDAVAPDNAARIMIDLLKRVKNN